MTISVLQTITGTGAQEEIDIGSPKVISFVLNSTAGTPTGTLEVLLHPEGTWSDSGAIIVAGTVQSTIGPIVKARLNVSATGTNTTFEVVGISR